MHIGTNINFKALIQKERTSQFKSPYTTVYDEFVKLGYDKKDYNFFKNNASSVVEALREACWNYFVPTEKQFTRKMLSKLIDEDKIKNLDAKESIVWFIDTYTEQIYELTLSNTQSRRTRAGAEFEAIIELILTGANIPYDSQGNIGKKGFIEKNLGKLVDVVSPGVVEYVINKRNTILISAKTTLRERWQEVPEEVGRTGAREMFLATLDSEISDVVLATLYDANIQVVTTINNKEQNYKENNRVLTFEDLIEICHENSLKWEGYNFSEEEIEQKKENIKRQIKKHLDHEFVKEYLSSMLDQE